MWQKEPQLQRFFLFGAVWWLELARAIMARSLGTKLSSKNRSPQRILVKMDMQDEVTFAEETARKAGQLMREYFWAYDKGTTLKRDKSPVTIADTKINKLVIDCVGEAFPKCGVLGEEASTGARSGHDLWVCDPIDGTAGFVVGVPTAMFSLAFVRDGVPLVGVAYDPFMDRMFTAVKGGGASCNSAPLMVSKTPLLKGSIIAASGSFRDVHALVPLYESLASQGARVAFVPGAVFRGCLLADSRIDACAFAGAGAYDIAACKVIIEEAGGRVTDIAGNEQRYDRPINGAILSNGLVHHEFAAVIAEFGVDRFMSLKR